MKFLLLLKGCDDRHNGPINEPPRVSPEKERVATSNQHFKILRQVKFHKTVDVLQGGVIVVVIDVVKVAHRTVMLMEEIKLEIEADELDADEVGIGSIVGGGVIEGDVDDPGFGELEF